MKTPLLLLLISASPAFAATRATPSQMREDVKNFSRTIQSIEGCDFRVTENADGGFTITMTNDRAGGAVIAIAPNSKITLESGEEREDGSFSKSYKVEGAGELDLVHADDAYDHAFLTDRDGRVLSCEVDY